MDETIKPSMLDFDHMESVMNDELFYPAYETHRIIVVEDNFLYDYQLPLIDYILDELAKKYVGHKYEPIFMFIKEQLVNKIYALTIDYTLEQAADIIQVLVLQIMQERVDKYQGEDMYEIMSILAKLKNDYKRDKRIIKWNDKYLKDTHVDIIKSLLKKEYDIYLTIDVSMEYDMDNIRDAFKNDIFKDCDIKYIDITKANKIEKLLEIRRDTIQQKENDHKGFDMMYSDSPDTILALTNEDVKLIDNLIKMLLIPIHKIVYTMELTNKKALELINTKLKLSNIMVIPMMKKESEEIGKK